MQTLIWLLRPASAFMLAIAAVGMIGTAAGAQIALPAPEGPAAVGYWAGDIETGQPDRLKAEAGVMRRLNLQIWYPAAADPERVQPPKRWSSAPMGAALSKQFPFPKGFETEIRAHAIRGAAPAGTGMPVIIFSHGLSFPPALYQSFFEALASRGYAVVAVAHPHGATLIEYTDGRTLDMSRWPRPEVETERQKFLAEHAAVWVADLEAVLDWTVAGATSSPVQGLLDTDRIGMMGHSYGGTAVGRLSRDRRVNAIVVLEGLVRDPATKDGRGTLTVDTPLLHIIGGYNRLEHEGGQYAPGPSAPVFQVVINGTGHAELSDLIYLYSAFADENWKARRRYALDPSRVLQIAGDYAVGFFDHYLRGAELPVLLRPKSYAARVDSPGAGGYPEVDLSIAVE